MVHRLRNWEEGQTVWGYEVISNGGASMGKTHTRRDFTDHSENYQDDSDEFVPQIIDSMQAMLDNTGDDSVSAGFAWVAEIESVQTEPPGPDPGEPPLKKARFRKLVVMESAVR
jgi:hypothetical protein